MRLDLYITQKTLAEKNIHRDLICRAKNTNSLDCFFYNEEDLLVDITGCEIYFMIKATPSTVDASAALNKKITTLTNPSAGETEIELTSTDTASLLGNYLYQLKIKYDSKWYTVAEGNICFLQSIITRES
jgi:hypothetical protein